MDYRRDPYGRLAIDAGYPEDREVAEERLRDDGETAEATATAECGRNLRRSARSDEVEAERSAEGTAAESTAADVD